MCSPPTWDRDRWVEGRKVHIHRTDSLSPFTSSKNGLFPLLILVRCVWPQMWTLTTGFMLLPHNCRPSITRTRICKHRRGDVTDAFPAHVVRELSGAASAHSRGRAALPCTCANGWGAATCAHSQGGDRGWVAETKSGVEILQSWPGEGQAELRPLLRPQLSPGMHKLTP